MLQFAIAAVAAVIFLLAQGGAQAVAAFFGGTVSAVSSLLLRRGVIKANEIAQEDPRRGMMALYIGAVQRFVLVLALFGLGLGFLGIDPLASVVGFGASQLAYAVMMRKSAHPGPRKNI